MWTIRFLLFLCILVGYPSPSWSATEQESQEVSHTVIKERKQLKELSRRRKDLSLLEKAKIFLINGNIPKAKRQLLLMKGKRGISRNIKLRYMALIHFLEGDYLKSFNLLKDPAFDPTQNYQKICSLRILNAIILSSDPEFVEKTSITKIKKFLSTESSRCSFRNLKYTNSDHRWMESLVDLRRGDISVTSGDHLDKFDRWLGNDEIFRVWLKLGIYLNKEEIVENHFFQVPEHFYKDKRIREMMGHIYYRLGDVEKSLTFLEGVKGPNASNIKGNIHLYKKEYEIAYGHFQLALKNKANSANAIQRIIPLTWILKRWEDGLKNTRKAKTYPQNKIEKMATEALFLTKMKKYPKAIEYLREITKLIGGKQLLPIAALYLYNSLMVGDLRKAKLFAQQSCEKNDGLGCWFQFQLRYWDDLSQTLKSSEPIAQDKELSFENLKLKAKLDPLDDRIYIDQKDIEELDGIYVDEVKKK